MLIAPNPSRERILVAGAPGSGKTYALLNLARAVAPAKVYVIDTDDKVEAMLYTEFSDLTNVITRHPIEFEDILKLRPGDPPGILDEFVTIAQAGDWISCDLITPVWQMAQDVYSRLVFGEDLTAHALSVRAEMQQNPAAHKDKRGGFEGRKDWGEINKIYRKFMNTLIHRHPANVFCTAGVEAFNSRDAEAFDRSTYGPHGLKPRGQKEIGHHFRSIILMKNEAPGDYRMVTMRDDGRQDVMGAPTANFVYSYMVPVAGWRPGEAAA